MRNYLAAIIALWCLGAACFAENPVATIVRLNGASGGNIEVVSADGRRRAALLDTLHAGDRIELDQGGVQVQYWDGEVIHISAQHTPYEVREATRRSNLLSNVWVALSSRFSRDAEQASRSLITRDGGSEMRFAVGGLEDGVARLLVAERPILLRWRGGFGPYRISLLDDQRRVLQSMESNGRTAFLNTVSGNAGDRFRIEIIDADGSALMGEFEFTSEIRPKPLEEIPEGLGSVATALEAVWLAEQDSSVWSFEALQMLALLPAETVDRAGVADLIDFYSDSSR